MAISCSKFQYLKTSETQWYVEMYHLVSDRECNWKYLEAILLLLPITSITAYYFNVITTYYFRLGKK